MTSERRVRGNDASGERNPMFSQTEGFSFFSLQISQMSTFFHNFNFLARKELALKVIFAIPHGQYACEDPDQGFLQRSNSGLLWCAGEFSLTLEGYFLRTLFPLASKPYPNRHQEKF